MTTNDPSIGGGIWRRTTILAIRKAGKVVVQLPAAITSNLATFNTPGTTTWTSPVTGQVEFTCVGGSGGGSNGVACSYPGGNGGPSGRAVTVISAVAGQVYDVVVGAFGDHSALLSGGPIPPPSYYLGFSGTASRVSLSGVVLCQGDGGVLDRFGRTRALGASTLTHPLVWFAAPALLEGGVVERWAERPVTRFERKGLAVGRSITDLRFVRTETPAGEEPVTAAG